MRLLIAEDDLHMNKILAMYLTKSGYTVTTAFDGQEALDYAYKTPFDLIILDWMMPKIDGITVCKELKSLASPPKIIMLTAKSEVEDEALGLTCGADDYIRKPFDPKILLLRVQKLLPDPLLTFNELTLDLKSHTVTRNQQPITLSKKEFDLLACMMLNPKHIFSREQLLDKVWGLDYDGDGRTVDTHIRRLRGKIGEGFIMTHRGFGYSLENSDE